MSTSQMIYRSYSKYPVIVSSQVKSQLLPQVFQPLMLLVAQRLQRQALPLVLLGLMRLPQVQRLQLEMLELVRRALTLLVLATLSQ